MEKQVKCYKLEGENNCSFMLKLIEWMDTFCTTPTAACNGVKPVYGSWYLFRKNNNHKRAGICIQYIHKLTIKGSQKKRQCSAKHIFNSLKQMTCLSSQKLPQCYSKTENICLVVIWFMFNHLHSPRPLLRKCQRAICSIRMQKSH